jgi:hypothetical protein
MNAPEILNGKRQGHDKCLKENITSDMHIDEIGRDFMDTLYKLNRYD